MAVLTELSEKVHFSVTIIICDAVNFNPYECQRSTEEFVQAIGKNPRFGNNGWCSPGIHCLFCNWGKNNPTGQPVAQL